MTTLPLSEVKARLSEIAEEVASTHERVQITKNGREYVVLISADDLESLEATLELLADHAAQARIPRADEDIAKGDVLDEEAVRAALATRPEGRRMSSRVVVTRTAARQLAEHLPEAVEAACVEFIFGALAEDPHRVGAPLRRPFEGQWRARRGEYRVRYRVDEPGEIVYVVDVDHRRDVYRS